MAVDDEPGAVDLLRTALDLHRRFGTEVHVVHAVDLPDPEWVGMRADVVAEMEADIQTRALDALAVRLREVDPKDELRREDHLLVQRGRPAQVLVSHARKVGADLLMLGPHRERGVLDFGSTTRGVMASAKCDLWIQPRAPRPIRKVLVPVDLSEESLRALAQARRYAEELEAGVTALHCFQVPVLAYAPTPAAPSAGPTYVADEVRESAREEFHRALEDFDWGPVEHELRFVEGEPAASILELQGEHDLIAIGTHGRTGLARALLGNVAYQVLRSAEVPVLAIRHPERHWLLG